MAPSESVIGKKQFHYVDGEAVELSPDKEKYEEARKQKMEFSKEIDRFIWLVFALSTFFFPSDADLLSYIRY